MKIRQSEIRLHNLRFHARHGVLPQEQLTGNDYVVNVSIGYPLERAVSSDQVTDTLDYAAVYAILRRQMEQPSRLIEHLAGRMQEALTAAFPSIRSIRLEVTKVNPPMGADCDGASVCISWER